MTVQLTEKAGVDGRLFGSVTNLNVVEALRKQGFNSVDKTMVKFPEGPLKTDRRPQGPGQPAHGRRGRDHRFRSGRNSLIDPGRP